MNEVYEAALDLQSFVQSHGWPYCFIGGVAVQRWSRPRATKDADMTVLTRFELDAECIRELSGRFALWMPQSLELAERVRVLFLKHSNGIRLDVALGALEFEERAISRASWWVCDEKVRLFTCSAEDLVVHKAYASRPQDWVDIEGILEVQGARLKIPQILNELQPLALLKEDDGIITQLEHRLRKHGLL